MTDAIAQFIADKFGPAIRHDEPLEFTVDEFRRAVMAAARAQGPGPGEAVAWRPEVVAFANLMETQLRANDHKPGWKGEEASPLISRLFEEANELDDEFHNGSRTDAGAWRASVGREAADVANFAMMIADVCGALAATPTREAQT